MIHLVIPQRGMIEIEHAVFDVNGTLAVDGIVLPGVTERLQRLSEQLSIHILTAGTHGHLAELEHELGHPLHIIQTGEDKARFVQELDPTRVVAFGNGANDASMLRLVAIGIAVFTTEGVATAALQAADILANGPTDALDLLLHSNRLVATLRG